MSELTAQRLVFPAKQRVELESHCLPDPGPEQVQVAIDCSLMSTGTENIVFNGLYAPGTHWDHWVKFPFHPGYAATGVVEATGAEVTGLQPGDRVACRCGHASHAVLPAAACYPVPEELPRETAVWFALAKIAFQGTMAASYRLGDSVAIIGAGPIGQMALRWARAGGAFHVAMVDPVPEREKAARAGGADTYLALPAGEAREAVLAANGGRAPRVVVDSTGHAAVFAAALGLAAPAGRVVVLGDTGEPSRQALTSDVIMKGLTITGAHDGNRFEGWDEPRAVELFFKLARDGRFPLHNMVSHVFPPGRCADAYATANTERAKTMGILFDWKAVP